MKPLITLLIPALLLTVTTSGQTPDFTQWLKKKTVDGKEMTVLRAPELKFSSKILGHISIAQMELDRLPNYYNQSISYAGVDLYRDIEKSCVNIEKEDPTYPVHYYRDEMKAFRELKEEMTQKALAKKKEKEEAEFFTRLKADYAWISGDSINVRTRPDAKSPGIGKIFRCSYIRAYELDNNPDWVQIVFGDHNGYVLRDDVAADWDELEPSSEDSARLLSQSHYFKPTAAYTAQLKKAAAEEARVLRVANAAPRRKYYTGPRGGCYYINSSGNKQYVDHSYCK